MSTFSHMDKEREEIYKQILKVSEMTKEKDNIRL